MAQNAAKPRAESFSVAEQNLLMELYDDYCDIITKKGNTAQINKAREAAWKTIADRLNASNLGGQKRTWQQVKIKYKNILTNATKKKAQLGATGGGPPPEEFTQAKSLALSYNKSPKIDGIQGGNASSPIDPAIRATFVEGTVLSTTIPLLHGDSPSVDLADC
ncbi:uncharacterized protein LOC120545684 isoform X5 [Xyrichtys novacula]|uniref:Uncharacterized protein LOC120545684 isoform X5 n=1 Tax=Xyrichtys novacula TaxID=13765 RepID=A0AAV1FJL1_XYRNO|nr:uncharacterized protein LOC120545684 isoform X5 [Xyrichtys novacula]